jgi:hypothetical protein
MNRTELAEKRAFAVNRFTQAVEDTAHQLRPDADHTGFVSGTDHVAGPDAFDGIQRQQDQVAFAEGHDFGFDHGTALKVYPAELTKAHGRAAAFDSQPGNVGHSTLADADGGLSNRLY